MFSTLSKINFNLSFTFILSSANAFNLDQSKILSFGKGLRPAYLCVPEQYDVTFYQTKKVLVMSNLLKAMQTKKINVIVKMISIFERVNSIMGKGVHPCSQHFFLLPQDS